MLSKLFRLNLKDLGKAVLVIVIVSVAGGIKALFQTQGLEISGADLMEVLNIALTAAGAYLVKNLFTNSKDEFGKAE